MVETSLEGYKIAVAGLIQGKELKNLPTESAPNPSTRYSEFATQAAEILVPIAFGMNVEPGLVAVQIKDWSKAVRVEHLLEIQSNKPKDWLQSIINQRVFYYGNTTRMSLQQGLSRMCL